MCSIAASGLPVEEAAHDGVERGHREAEGDPQQPVLSYDEWVATLRKVVFWRCRSARVTLLARHVLEWIAASDSFGQYVSASDR